MSWKCCIYNGLAHAVARGLARKGYLDSARTRMLPILMATGGDQRSVAMAEETEIVDRLRDAVDFMPVRDSDVIRILARSVHPEEATLLANSFARMYVLHNLDMSRARYRDAREFLEEQLLAKKEALEKAENDLQSYMRGAGVVGLDAEVGGMVEQLAQLDAMRDGLDIDISSRRTTVTSLQEELKKQEPNALRAMAESNDAYVRRMQEELANLQGAKRDHCGQ